MKRSLSIAAIIGISCLISACQTTNLMSQEANLYREKIATICKIVTYKDGVDGVNPRTLSQSISITSIDKGDDNWVRVGSNTSGFSDNVYHNTASDQFVCGWRNWRKLDLAVKFDR